MNCMYVPSSHIRRYITSDYGFLLRLVNTFTIDTDGYYPVSYKVNYAKTFKNLVYLPLLMTICILQTGQARLTGAFKIILSQCCVLLGITRRISNYMCQILFIYKEPTSFRKYTVVRFTSKEHLLIWNSETTLNIIFITTKKKQLFSQLKGMKNNYGMLLFKFFKNISFILNFWLASNTIKMKVCI